MTEPQDNAIFTPEQRARFRQLRKAQDAGAALSPDEQAELAALFQHIEDAEAAYLRPATERIRAERLALEEQKRNLELLVRRGETLVAHLEVMLADLRAKQQAPNSEADTGLVPATTPH